MYNIYHNRVAYNHNCFCSISNVHVKSTRNFSCNFYVYPVSTSLRNACWCNVMEQFTQ